ncbi:MAG: phage RhynO [Verrucomicrobiota bacterium]|jgi:hypothetical protein
MPCIRFNPPINKLPNGFVIYRGPSRFDGAPIAVVVTGIRKRSGNAKTGYLTQTWILPLDANGKAILPYVAVKDGSDQAVCGRCPLRWLLGGGCYVRLDTAPRQVAETFNAGGYVDADPTYVAEIVADHVRAGRIDGFRCGSWGDPAAVPASVWRAIVPTVRAANGVTPGYTHAWTERYATRPEAVATPEEYGFLMASAHGPADRLRARSAGFRAFTLLTEQATIPGTFTCPATEEAGYRRTCATCGSCDGKQAPTDRRADPVIVVHGGAKRRAASSIQA